MSQSVKRNTDADSQDFQECWGGSKTSLSIASVTLAYNAARILPRQMDALLRQSRPIDEIIVVDSGSTDGTGDLLAERVVIKIYSDMITFFGEADPVSRRMFEGILKDEEDHADEIADLLYTVDPKTGKTVEQFSGDSVSKAFHKK